MKQLLRYGGLLALVAALPLSFRAAWADDSQPHWTPPPSDPRDFGGVWLPGGYANAPSAAAKPPADAAASATPGNGPPPEIGGLDSAQPGPAGGPSGPGSSGGPPGGGGGPGGPGGLPPGAAAEQVSGSTLECTPVQRLTGAGGGMSNLWIVGPKEIVMISEEDMDVARKIYLNAQHPKKPIPQPNGNSIGHWDGNTLVVDTIGYSKPDGSLSDEHVVERIHKDGNSLIDQMTITQGGKTRQQTAVSSWRSDLHVSENVCEENYTRFHFENGELVDQTQ